MIVLLPPTASAATTLAAAVTTAVAGTLSRATVTPAARALACRLNAGGHRHMALGDCRQLLHQLLKRKRSKPLRFLLIGKEQGYLVVQVPLLLQGLPADSCEAASFQQQHVVAEGCLLAAAEPELVGRSLPHKAQQQAASDLFHDLHDGRGLHDAAESPPRSRQICHQVSQAATTCFPPHGDSGADSCSEHPSQSKNALRTRRNSYQCCPRNL